MEFLSMHLNNRFNITIDTSEYSFDYNKLKVLNVIHHNLYFIVPPKEEICTMLKNNNIKFYFNVSAAATNFRALEKITKIGVSSVYIADDLCYNLKRVRAACDQYGLEIR